MMTEPKLRNDLLITAQQAGGRKFFVLKDPVSRQFFRLQEAEYFIATQLDGQTPLGIVQEKAEKQFEAVLSHDHLTGFVAKLEKGGLLENNRNRRKSYTNNGKRIRGNLLYLRYAIFDPDALLNTLIGKVRFCFTTPFVSLSAGLILLATVILLTGWSSFTHDLSQLKFISSAPLFLIILFVVTSLHELAHALTCKYFGGEVHEMGFMMIYFQPALYCDVSDAWLFTEKSKRLWVGVAGPYFELLLWGIATIIWRLTDVESLINYLALMVMAASGIKTILNFNPFIKLDGYYLLSDYLEIPNLRRKSFQYVGALTKRFFGAPASTPHAETSSERKIFVLYGIVSTVASLMLLGFVLWNAGGYFIDNRQPFAFIFLSGLVTFGMHHRWSRLFGKPGSVETASSTQPAQAIKTERKIKSANILSKRRQFWLIAATVIIAAFFIPMELRISGTFAIQPAHNVDVRSQLEGIVQKIYVTESDIVQPGQLLALLSDREYQIELQKANAEILQAQAKLRMQEFGPTSEELSVARVEVDRARDRLEFARVRMERDQLTFKEQLISKKEFDETKEETALAESDYAEARSKLNLLLRGTRREEIEATRAEIERLEVEKQFLEGQIQRTEIRSPVAGVIATPARQLKEMSGQAVRKGELIAKVYDMKKLTVEIEIPEKEIADIKVGQKIAIRAQAYPDRTFEGKVSSIATTVQSSTQPAGSNMSLAGASNSSRRTVLVKTEIKNDSLLVKPGMTGQAKIFCGPRKIIEIISRRLIRTIKVEFWSWW